MKGPEHSVVMIDIAAQRDRDIAAGKPQTRCESEWLEELADRVSELMGHPRSECSLRRRMLLELGATVVAWLEDLERKHTPERWRQGT